MPNVRLPPTATNGAFDLREQSGNRELLKHAAPTNERARSPVFIAASCASTTMSCIQYVRKDLNVIADHIIARHGHEPG